MDRTIPHIAVEIQATYSYGPFGEPNQTAGSRFRYTGQTFMPNLGLYYYKARFYSANLGRFLQTDPIGVSGGLNLYSYVGNSPIHLNDPSGNCPNCVGALVGGGIDLGLQLLSNGGSFSNVSWGSVAVSAGLGFVGAGLANKASAIWRARDLPVSIGTKLAAQTTTKFEQGVYLAEANAGRYVGQSGQISTRLETHAAQSRFGAGSTEAADDAMRLAVGGGKTSREVAEQRVLNSIGGPNSPGVLNRVNPVGGRPSLLGNESLGVIEGIYVPGLSSTARGGVGALIGGAGSFGNGK